MSFDLPPIVKQAERVRALVEAADRHGKDTQADVKNAVKRYAKTLEKTK